MAVKKWYVNLAKEVNRGRARNHGPTIPIVATRKLGHTSKSLLRRRAHWEVEWEPTDHDQYMCRTPELKESTEELDNRTFANELVVPPIGGITFTVRVRKAEGEGATGVVLQEQYQAWRRLYYTVHYVGARAKRGFEAIEGELQEIFRECFITLVRRHVSRARGGDEEISVIDDRYFSQKYSGDLDRPNFHLRIVVVNRVGQREREQFAWALDPMFESEDLAYKDGRILAQLSLGPKRARSAVKVQWLQLLPQGVAQSPESVARESDQTFRITWSEKQNATFSVGGRLRIKGKVRGRAASEVITPSRLAAACDLELGNGAMNAVTVDGARLWVADGKVHCELTGAYVFNDQRREVELSVGASSTRVNGAGVEMIDEKHLAVSLALVEGAETALSTSGKLGVAVEAGRRNDVELEREKEHIIDVLSPNIARAVTDGDVHLGNFHRGFVVNLKKIVISQGDPFADFELSPDEQPIVLSDPGAEVAWDDAKSMLTIDLNQERLAPARVALSSGRKVHVNLDMTWVMQIGGYYANGSNVLVLSTIPVMDQDAGKFTLAVACHEIGHALGLVRSVQATKAGAELNPRHYEGGGGQGNHCSLNTREVEGFRVPSANPNEKLCLMYHTMGYLDRMDLRFCDVCKNHLIRNDVRLPK